MDRVVVQEVDYDEIKLNKNLTRNLDLKEGSYFNDKYDKFAKKSAEIQRLRDITFELRPLLVEGLQTLIDVYGRDRVFEVVKNEFNSKKPNDALLNSFDIIRKLEPDSKKRAELYERMKFDAHKMAADFKEGLENPNSDQNKYEYLRTVFGGDRSFLLASELKIGTLISFDTFLGRVKSILAFHNFFGNAMGHFASRVFQDSSEEDKFKAQLAEAGNNIFQLTENRNSESMRRREILVTDIDVLCEELTREIELITSQLNLEIEMYRSKILGDVMQLNTLVVESEEMKKALLVAWSNVESEIIRFVDITNQKIAEKTSPLVDIRNKLMQLRRSNY